MILLCPEVSEANAVLALLHAFGAASDLHFNIAKSSLSPARCQNADLSMATLAMGCPIHEFLIAYLVLHLSLDGGPVATGG